MRKRLFGVLVCASIVVTACGGATPSPATSSSPGQSGTPSGPTVTEPPASIEDLLFTYAYEPVEGQAGGSAVIGDWQAVANLNSYYDNSFTTSQTLAATMRGLWVTSSDGHWKSDLAAKMPKFSDGSIRQNDDGSFEVDLELRPGLTWSDGTDLTLNDLRYTWEWNLDPDQVGLVTGTVGWEDISDIEVSADGLSATVFFDKPYAGFYGGPEGPRSTRLQNFFKNPGTASDMWNIEDWWVAE